jgi:hypothetical protein
MTACTAVGQPQGSATKDDLVESGFRGVVQTETTLTVDNVLAGLAPITVAAGQSLRAEVEFVSQVVDRTCDEPDLDPPRPCPPLGENVLRYRATALLDLEMFLEASPGIINNPTTPRRSSAALTVDLPPLAEGRHCLVIAFLEDNDELIAGRFPDHSPVVYAEILAGDPTTDNCIPSSPSDTQPAFNPTSDAQCGGRPTISKDRSLVPPDFSAVIQLTGCSYPQYVVTVGDVTTAPMLVAGESAPGFYFVPIAWPEADPDCTWRAMVVPNLKGVRPSHVQPFTTYPSTCAQG